MKGMRFSASFSVCFSAALALAHLSACSSDSETEPAGQAGSGGNGGSPMAGASATAGKSSGGSASGGSAAGSGGSASGGGGSASGGGGGANGGGTAGNAGRGSGGSAGEPSGEVVADCLGGATPGETRTEALSFEGMGVRLGIVRAADPDSVGTSGTTPWLPQRFALERGDVQVCISEADALEYESSHHNFDDSMTATRDEQTWVFKQSRENYDEATQFSVQGQNGQAVLWGPITLTLKSCERLDMDGSCLDFYQ